MGRSGETQASRIQDLEDSRERMEQSLADVVDRLAGLDGRVQTTEETSTARHAELLGMFTTFMSSKDSIPSPAVATHEPIAPPQVRSSSPPFATNLSGSFADPHRFANPNSHLGQSQQFRGGPSFHGADFQPPIPRPLASHSSFAAPIPFAGQPPLAGPIHGAIPIPPVPMPLQIQQPPQFATDRPQFGTVPAPSFNFRPPSSGGSYQPPAVLSFHLPTEPPPPGVPIQQPRPYYLSGRPPLHHQSTDHVSQPMDPSSGYPPASIPLPAQFPHWPQQPAADNHLQQPNQGHYPPVFGSGYPPGSFPNPEHFYHWQHRPTDMQPPHLPPFRDSLSNRESYCNKIDLPVFTGEHAYAWLAACERFFQFGEYTEAQKIGLVSVSLTGRLSGWFNWEVANEPFADWRDFRLRLLARYEKARSYNPTERLLLLRQMGSIDDYVDEFQDLSAQVNSFSKDDLESIFRLGLKPELQSLLRLFKPRGITAMIAMVLEFDSTEISGMLSAALANVGAFPTAPPAHSHRPPPPAYRPPPSFQNRPPTSTPLVSKPPDSSDRSFVLRSNPPPAASSSASSNRGRRHLSGKDLADRKKQGLCYRCDERYSPSHRQECKFRDLRVMTVFNGFEVELAEDEVPDEILEEAPSAEYMSLSLHAFTGSSTLSATKMWGTIGKVKVVNMLDSGATHNFIAPSIVKKVKLSPLTDLCNNVALGTGVLVQSLGLCKDISFHVAGLDFVADFIALELGSADVILGVQWLRTLGICQVDWAAHKLSFVHHGVQVYLLGDPSIIRPTSALQVLKPQKFVHVYSEAKLARVSAHFSALVATTPEQFTSLIHKYKSIFELPVGLPPSREFDHDIRLVDGVKSVSGGRSHCSRAHMDEVENMVAQMLQAGIIRRSRSPFYSPVLLIEKKDSSWRFCVDYRALNRVTILDKYPIPLIDHLLNELHGAKCFSKLDLRSGYHQIRMKEEDVEKTAFRTHDGHYEFLVMPFGLVNAPATFQALMNDIFRPFMRKFVLGFFDDILIYSPSLEQHKEHLAIVLQVLQDNLLFANQKKCAFGLSQIEYLGYVVSGEGVSTDDSKTKDMLAWPVPSTIKDLRGFLGLTGYYRRFVKNYGSIARPLSDLLRKDAFVWGSSAQHAFETLKRLMSSTPVLALPNFQQPFIVESDASGFGLGAVLMQDHNPLAYFSYGLTEQERLKPIYERELMAIVMAIRKWRHYLLGRKFIVRTDQKSLKFFLEQREVSMEYQRWLTKIFGYDFDIVYKLGIENKAADGLSRITHNELSCFTPRLLALTIPSSIQIEDVFKEIDEDTKLQEMLQGVRDGSSSLIGFSIIRDRLHYKGRLYIPRSSAIIPVLKHEFHDSLMGGHAGVFKTVKRIQQWFHWEGIFSDIQKYVAACVICQTHKTSTLAPAGLLQPLPIPDRVWEDISLDFIEGLPCSHGFNVILVVVDRLTKYGHFLPMRHPFTAINVAAVFTREIVRLHGFPASIVSDRDRIILSSFWRESFRLAGTVLQFSTAFHPQSDGQTEVLNRCVETYLRCFASSKPKGWYKFLAWAELSYNTAFHTALKSTPFRAVYGRDPPSLIRFENGSTGNFDLERNLLERDAMLSLLKEHLVHAQQIMKNNADKHRRDLEFEVGEKVYLKLRPYRQHSVAKRLYQKLAAKFYGPFEVLARVGKVAYRLKLPSSSRIHPVFHVSQLKPAIGKSREVLPLPTSFSLSDELLIEPVDIMGTLYNSNGDLEVLVSWKGLADHEHTWTLIRDFVKQFPDFQLADKLSSGGAGTDTPWKVYTRRKHRTGEGAEPEQREGPV